MKKKTVADQEKLTGNPDSIRNPNGKNARSDKHIETLGNEAAKLSTQVVLPEDVPQSLVFHYADGRIKPIVGDGVKVAAAYLNALGMLD